MKKNYLIRMVALTLLLGAFLTLSQTVKAQLYINEFMASNDVAFPGPAGDYPDWIEIYNAGTEAVNLAGYYMSDDLYDPSKMFRIPDTYPDSVTVPAGGYILFFANKDEDLSVMNLDFALSGDGEEIGFWNPSQEFVDSITYGSQEADISFGRYPDGSATWYAMTDYTPGASNHHITGVIDVVENISFVTAYPNPANETAQIKFSLDEPAFVTIMAYTLTGNLVSEISNEQFGMGENSIQWNVSELKSGVYFYVVSTGETTVTQKILVVR
ncbi:MAG: lamin tail domain-containing protein [Bacteroidales bacterium]|jgi:hypothetical protein